MDELEYRLMAAFRAMSPEARIIALDYLEALAKKRPAPVVVPLRLVVGQRKIK